GCGQTRYSNRLNNCFTSRLFECIGMRCGSKKQGSPGDYDAGAGCIEQLAQQSQTGEPHDCHSLYRNGRTQEEHQLLHQESGREGSSGRQGSGLPARASTMGRRATAAMEWSDGGHAVQFVGVRHAEALCRASGDGTSSEDEGDQRRQEEERQDRCAHHRRSTALRSVASLLCDAAGDARSQTAAALSQSGGAAVGADAKQDGRAIDGERDGLSKREAAWEEILLRAHAESGRSTGVGQRPAPHEPQLDGDVPVGAEANHPEAVVGAELTAAHRASDEHPRSGSDHSVDLGVGSCRPTSLLLGGRCRELLRSDRGVPVFSWQAAARTYFQATQCLVANGANRSSQTGTAMEPTTGGTAWRAAGTRSSQPRHTASSTQAGCLSAGSGQKRSSLPGDDLAATNKRRHEDKNKNARFTDSGRLAATSVRSVSGPPAGPCVLGDYAREQQLLMHSAVCFEAGRFTLTQSSRTPFNQRCSRKWMSGHAAYALVLPQDRGQFVTQDHYSPGDPLPPRRGKSPFSLDSYLSWMSPAIPIRYAGWAVVARTGAPLRKVRHGRGPGPDIDPSQQLRRLWIAIMSP